MTEISLDSKLKKRTLYIFLVRTDSIFSRVIALFTNTKYTHAAIGFDAQCHSLYSFSRLQTHMPIPAGFVKESTKSGLLSLSPNAPCAVYRINVTEQAFDDVRAELRHMCLNKGRYSYNYLGPVCCFFGIPLKIKNRYFCSQFVAEMLAKHRIAHLSKPASLYHPRDIAKIEGLDLIFSGTLSELKSNPEKAAVNIKVANG
jgi:inositol transport system substrate-binding protein